ncbi:MAG: hypothetical protein AAGF59_04425, partial [Pseudomonadota bacterium]
IKRLSLVALASVLMGVGLVLSAAAAKPFLFHDLLLVRASALGVLVCFGVGLFVGLCQLTGAADFLSLARRIIRRRTT